MNYTINLKPESELTIVNRINIGIQLPKMFSKLEDQAVNTQILLQETFSSIEVVVYKSLLEVIANFMTIYNSEKSDYQVLYDIIAYIESIQENSMTSAHLKLVAEVYHNIFKDLIKQYRLGSVIEVEQH